ncbi:hypothetical protein D5086_021252 [Populus alba]|uniref:Uncharacterized protein n=1 Tax=Populus alba TaxID=43335 RepID=A0ACC4BBJ7_POPAL
MEKGPYFWVYDDRVNVSDVVGFNQSRMTLLGKKGKKRNVIIIVVIVPIAVSVILIVCVCIFLRARKQKEEEEVKDLYEMEDVELFQLDFGTVREATGHTC